MHNTDHLFESLFRRNFRSVDTKAFLTALTKEYPYFTAAQFYLLKLSEDNSRDFANNAAKTSLLFNNPFWLNFQLNQSEKTVGIAGQSISEKEPLPGETIETSIQHPGDENDLLPQYLPVISSGDADELLAEDTVTAGHNDTQVEQLEQKQVTQEFPVVEKEAPELSTFLSSTEAKGNNVQTSVDDAFAGNNSKTHTQKDDFFDGSLENIKSEDSHGESAPAIDATEVADVAVTTSIQEINTNHHHNLAEETESLQAPPENVTQSPLVDEETKETIINETNSSEPDESSETETQPMILKLDFDVKSTTTEDTISYQPLYTSDYFASLGIKINENGLPVDRLGKQLKSFTDWLKIMKRIHPDHLPQLDEVIDNSIQEIAEKSNKKGDVLTEAMADVLIQQGKTSKAVELYQKLSLLNPSKSAYFAAKIDEIKR